MAPTKQQYETVSFGDSTLYTGAASIPEGDYALKFTNILDRGKDGKLAEMLKVKVQFFPLPFEDGAKVLEYSYGMGKKAHLSMRPHPEDPRMLVRVPDGPSPNLNNNTKWAIFKNSLHNNGMEEGVLTDTFEAIDGLHVHMTAQPAPKEWGEIGKNDDLAGEGGEGNTNGKYTPGMIPVVGMILDDGKPWDNGGGLPGEAEVATGKPVAAAKSNGKPAAKPAATKGKAAKTEDIGEVASNAIAAHMAANENGCSTTALKTGCFAWITKNYSDEVAQTFMTEVAEDKESIATILSELGYEIKGIKVTPAA